MTRLGKILSGWAITLSALMPLTSAAYLVPVHYQLTYLVAQDCGLSDEESATIAWANSFTDIHPDASPGVRPNQWTKPRYIEIRRLFHFPSSNIHEKVERNSSRARLICEFACENAATGEIDPILLGMGMHGLQDSFSHEGYGPIFGHATSQKPDYPFLRPELAEEMAEVTWNMLDLWSLKAHGIPCRNIWPVVRDDLAVLIRLRADRQDELGELWKSEVERLLGKEVPVLSRRLDDPRAPAYLKNVERVFNSFGMAL